MRTLLLLAIAISLAGCAGRHQRVTPIVHHKPDVAVVSRPVAAARASAAQAKSSVAEATVRANAAASIAAELSSAAAQLIQLPNSPALTPEGRALILEFETGGRSGYNPHPEWPGFASGVTIGIGYDCGYNSRVVIVRDWRALAERDRLAATSGVTGIAAKSKAREVRDILIAWQLAEGVFNEVTTTKFWQLAQRTFPGFDELHPNAQAALVSLVFNRGSSMSGPRRVEMRAIRDHVARKDYAGIAKELRAMTRLWRGTDIETGMARRRGAEARLVELRGGI